MNDSTLVLTESKSARADKMASMTHDSAMNALCKAKALVMAMWQGAGVATTEQMADYYEVPVDTVKSVVKNNRDELTSDGLKVLRGKDLKDVRLVIDLTSEQAKIPSLTIWTPRAALRLGMLLRDSEVAKQVRTVLLDVAMQVSSFSVPVKPILPSRELALETARSVSEIKDLLADTDPRLCQLLVDVAINDAVQTIKAIAKIINHFGDRKDIPSEFKHEFINGIKHHGLPDGEGWNVFYEPCPVIKITPMEVVVQSRLFPSDVPFLCDGGKFNVNKTKLQRDGKAYHSRHGEYFYIAVPDSAITLPQSRQLLEV